MHDTRYSILNLFKKNSEKEFSTTQIVSEVFKDQLTQDKSMLTDKERKLLSQRLKAKLHRKILYHLNQLVDENILKITKTAGKGEKFFALALGHDEEIIVDKYKKRIIISKSSQTSMPIDGYESQMLIQKYEPGTWIDKLNSILIECTRFDTVKKLASVTNSVFPYVNDAIGLNDFEYIIQNNPKEDVKSFISKLEIDCQDYNKRITLIIDLTNIDDKQAINGIMEHFTTIKSNFIEIIFDIRSKELQDNMALLEDILKLFISAKIRFNVKNQDIYQAPYIIGRAGPYSFSEKEWLIYKQEFQGKLMGLACAQSTIAVDVEKFFQVYNSHAQFRSFIMNITKSLLYANSFQRSRSEEYFKEIIDLNRPFDREFFIFDHNYVRFWNYGWKNPKIDHSLMIDLIKSSKAEVDKFCISEETIYKSCGMPTRFKVAFSCCYKEFSRDMFSGEKFQKLQINKLENLYSDELKKYLEEKERIFEIFDGGDRARLFRSDAEPREMLREINIILNTYKLPFFCYDFGELKGSNLKLTSFMD